MLHGEETENVEDVRFSVRCRCSSSGSYVVSDLGERVSKAQASLCR